MSYEGRIVRGQPINILDEGMTIATNIKSIDFAGDGVTGGAVGPAVTETIPGGGGGGNAFDSNKPTTANGLTIGTNVGGSTVQDFLNAAYFPAVAPGASLGGGGAREMGASPSVSLAWTATKNTNPITSIIVNSVSHTPTGNTQSGTDSATATQNVNTTFYMTVSDGTLTGNANTTVSWYFKRYIGASASTTLDEAGIEGLTLDTNLAAYLNGTYAFGASATYKYFCCPDSFATPTATTGFKDAGTLLPIGMADSGDDAFYSHTSNGWSYGLVSVTNSTATPVTTNYRVYRSKNILNGAITIIVS